ncbi:YqhG family protein, partial [Gordoniibacillus kamchatkensis]|uniref:YqhG family protein n=1 Tax=Gordoniibacillus kamchatkensis TaxID=1590651 RepID=UPI001E46D966
RAAVSCGCSRSLPGPRRHAGGGAGGSGDDGCGDPGKRCRPGACPAAGMATGPASAAAASGAAPAVPLRRQGVPPAAAPPAATYETWLLVNYKVELVCDMKRSEIHSLAVSLTTGRIRERFYEEVLSRRLSPRLPDNVRLLPVVVPLEEAASRLEQHLERIISGYDHSWADRANERLRDELARIDGYYGALLQSVEPDKRAEARAQYDNRKREIDWQYRPRIEVSAINCGLFHLAADGRQ